MVENSCDLELIKDSDNIVQTERSRWERGMATIEYAIGLLAAATLALVLIRIFNDNEFTKLLFDWVLDILRNIDLPR